MVFSIIENLEKRHGNLMLAALVAAVLLTGVAIVATIGYEIDMRGQEAFLLNMGILAGIVTGALLTVRVTVKPLLKMLRKIRS